MLVLSRKSGERVLIGDEIKITIVRLGPNTVRLGIDAPGHLNIVREELADQVIPDSSIQVDLPPVDDQHPKVPVT